MSDEQRRPVLISGATRILECCESTARRLADSGVLPCTRTPGGVRVFDEAAVRKVAAERKERRGS